MHVKQLTTSQASQTIPRKVTVYQDIKALQVSLLKRVTGGGKSAAARGYLRSQDSYLHIPQIYCNTLLSTNSTAGVPQEEPVLAGLTRTPTEQNITTMGDLVIAMCFRMVCYDSERQEDYNTQYSISLASEDNPKRYCKKTTRLPLRKYSLFSALGVIVSCCWHLLFTGTRHRSCIILTPTPTFTVCNGMCSACLPSSPLTTSPPPSTLTAQWVTSHHITSTNFFGVCEDLLRFRCASGPMGQFSLLAAVPNLSCHHLPPPLRTEEPRWSLPRFSLLTPLIFTFSVLYAFPNLQRLCTRL